MREFFGGEQLQVAELCELFRPRCFFWEQAALIKAACVMSRRGVCPKCSSSGICCVSAQEAG